MNIVIRGTNWIGDAVMTVPAVRQLRQVFADARISLLTPAWAEGIFRDANLFDEIIAFDRTGTRFTDIVGQVKLLRPHEFDVAILFTNSFASAFIMKLAGINTRIGYATDGRSFLLTHPVAVPDWKRKRHEVFYYLNLASEVETAVRGSVTLHDGKVEPMLEVSEPRRFSAHNKLVKAGVDRSRRTIALAPGSTNSRAKRWPAESFAALNDQLQRELNANVILLGSPDEQEVSNAVSAASTAKPIDLTGKTNLADAVAIVSEIDLLISNDMGLAHIAPAVGTRTITIFGPTDPTTTKPLGSGSEIMNANVECAPCMLRDCPIDHRCMTRITPEEVFDKARSMLEEDELTLPPEL
jgi:heptosyltransferase-2